MKGMLYFSQTQIRVLAFALAITHPLLSRPCLAETQVNTSTKPGAAWRLQSTIILENLPSNNTVQSLDQFGGLTSPLTKATGFFHTQLIGQRWWLVTPDGGLFISRGMNSVSQITTPGGRASLKQKFGSSQEWATQTLDLLRNDGFNTLGAWSDTTTLKSASKPMAQTILWSFMSSYGKKRGGTRQESGHTGYPNDCPFIFDPEFEPFCENYAKKLDSQQQDPWIIGHFSDNELPWSRKMLENYLSLPSSDAGHRTAINWLENRHDSSIPITEDDRSAFLAFAIDKYLTITGGAIRKHAPHHLFLGPRLHETVYHLPEVFATLGHHVDIVCVNYYRAWSPLKKLMESWSIESGKPLMITEFYAKGEDSGMGNTGGAGWLVKTQKDRGAFYQNFTLGLIKSKVCVGWSWHRYADNDPDDKNVDPSNRDSNKGIVSNRYNPFIELLESMKPLNLQVYNLVSHFDSSN